MQMLIPSRRCHQQHGYRGCWRPSAFPVAMAWKKPLGSDDAAIGVRMPDELYLSSKCSVTFVGKRHPLKCSSKPTFLHKTLQFDRNLQNLNFNRMSWGRYFEESSNSGPDRLTWQQFSPMICWIFFSGEWKLQHLPVHFCSTSFGRKSSSKRCCWELWWTNSGEVKPPRFSMWLCSTRWYWWLQA